MSFLAPTRLASLFGAALLTTGAATGVTSAAEAPPDLDGPAAGTWLIDQLSDDVVMNEEFGFADLGLTLDVLAALDELGDFDQDVERMVGTLEGQLEGYIGFEDDVFAGATAKAAVVWSQVGEDPRDVAGTDLVAAVESTVVTEGEATGRIVDQMASGDDFANVIGQVHAAQALSEADADLAGDALDYLLAQQCSDGFFRLYFAPIDGPQACDEDPQAEANPDATAQAVLALRAIGGAEAEHAADRATAWLVEAQDADGSFDGGSELPEANANSTGLAARALAASGEGQAAREARDWLGAVQLRFAGDDDGAVASNPADFAEASEGEIPAEARDTWVRATADAARAFVGSDEAAPGTTADADEESGSNAVWWIGGGLAALLGLVGVIVALRSKSSRGR